MDNISTTNKSRTGIGVLFFFFGYFVGLVAGLLLYPAGTVERTTFLKGFKVGAIVMAAVVGFAAVVGGIVAFYYYCY